MINHIFGKCTFVSNRYIIIENDNVGYKIMNICKDNYEADKNYKIFVHKINKIDVKNNIIEELYGFLNPMQRNLFIDLLSISGIGIITASNIIANNNCDLLIDLIRNKNIDELNKLYGISQRNAVLIITELYQKFSKKYISNKNNVNLENNQNNDLILALKQLGYKTSDIKLALSECKEDLPLNEMINKSIKIIAKSRINA